MHERPLSRRQVYEYLVATAPETVDVTLLTVADRLATQGPRTRSDAIESHLELAREMIAEARGGGRDRRPRRFAATSSPPSSGSSRGPTSDGR